jgi:hypothetical protein
MTRSISLSTLSTPPTTFTPIPSKAAFTHVMDNIFQNDNDASALKEDGIEDMFGLLMLTDTNVDKLTYLDPDPNNTASYSLKKGEISLIR